MRDPLDAPPTAEGVRGAWDDLAYRLREKAFDLDGLAKEQLYRPEVSYVWAAAEFKRLSGKAEGVRLALSFVEEYRRALVPSEGES